MTTKQKKKNKLTFLNHLLAPTFLAHNPKNKKKIWCGPISVYFDCSSSVNVGQKVTGQKVTDKKSRTKSHRTKSQLKFCILTKHIGQKITT
jgi:hypothetical protein